MAYDPTFTERCEEAVAQNRSFTATVDGEQQTISVGEAATVLRYFNMLNVPTRVLFNTLSTSGQLQLAATVTLFDERQN